jgi:hypothetical protein
MLGMIDPNQDFVTILNKRNHGRKSVIVVRGPLLVQ